MKKSICILTSLALIVCALFAVVGCGDKEDTRSSRELDTNILNIWQDAYGSVWVELENYEHDDYQFVSISGQSATSIDFSLDGGKTWNLCDVAESLFPEKDRGVYQIISPGTDGTLTFQLTGAEDNQFPDPSPIYNAGDVLSITIRVPESDTYKASAWSKAATYTLKAPAQSTTELFAYHYGAFLNDKTSYEGLIPNDFESNGFVAYKDANLIKIGKLASAASAAESGMYDYTFTPFEELSQSDKAEAAKFEYKFVSKQEYTQNEDVAGTFTPDVTINEDTFLTTGWKTGWITGSNGIAFNADDPDLLWAYDVEIPGATTGETEIYTQTSFVLLLRLKATDDTTHSSVAIFEYQLSYEPKQ